MGRECWSQGSIVLLYQGLVMINDQCSSITVSRVTDLFSHIEMIAEHGTEQTPGLRNAWDENTDETLARR